jgi:hypothetical protein
MKKSHKILTGVGAAIAVLIIAVVTLGMVYRIDPENLPKFVTSNVLHLSDIGAISKFRSNAGHDFSVGGETCRSMKHYFAPVSQVQGQFIDDQALLSNETYPLTVPVLAPTTGKITAITEEQFPLGKQISIRPDGYPQFTIRLFHVYPNDGVEVGTQITAGEEIGKIKSVQQMDVAVQSIGLTGTHYYSVYDVMDEFALAGYIDVGITSADTFSISKEERDAHPLTCNGEDFADASKSRGFDTDNWIVFPGLQ